MQRSSQYTQRSYNLVEQVGALEVRLAQIGKEQSAIGPSPKSVLSEAADLLDVVRSLTTDPPGTTTLC